MFEKYDDRFKTREVLNTNGEYTISYTGNIVTALNEPVSTFLDADGYETASLITVNGVINIRVIDLIALHFKWIDDYVCLNDCWDVQGFPIDGDRLNVHAANVGYRYANGKLEHPVFKGFYYIPGHPAYCINANGVLINSIAGNTIQWYRSKPVVEKNILGGYRSISYNKLKRSAVVLRHRALLMTFKPFTDDVDRLQVNHINGIPGDDRLENLEWVTPGENLEHAYSSNLRSQNLPVLALNLRTGEIVEYHSIAACARALNCCDMVVGNIANKVKKHPVSKDGYTFKFVNDTSDWFIPDNVEEYISRLSPTPVAVRDCASGNIYYFNKISDAANHTGVKEGTIENRLRRKLYTPSFGWQFIPNDGVTVFPAFDIEEYRKSLEPAEYAVDARNLLTGEVARYNSISEMEKAHGIAGISARFRSNQQPIFSSGWQFKTGDNDWVHIADPVSAVRSATKEITAYCIATKTYLILPSARSARSMLGIDPQQARRLALHDTESIYRGYRFCIGVNTKFAEN